MLYASSCRMSLRVPRCAPCHQSCTAVSASWACYTRHQDCFCDVWTYAGQSCAGRAAGNVQQFEPSDSGQEPAGGTGCWCSGDLPLTEPSDSATEHRLTTGLGQALHPSPLPTPSTSQSIPGQPTCRLQLPSSSRSWRPSTRSRQSTALRWRGSLLRRSAGRQRARRPVRTRRRSCWRPGSTSRSSAARCTLPSRQSSSCGPRWVGPAVAWQVLQEKAMPVVRDSADETVLNRSRGAWAHSSGGDTLIRSARSSRSEASL